MRRLAALAGLCLLLVGPASAQVLSRHAFTQHFAEAVRAQSPAMRVKVRGDLQLAVRDPMGIDLSLNLENAYAEYAANPAAQREVVQRYVDSLVRRRPLGAQTPET